MRLQPRISLVAQRHARKRGCVWPKQLDTSNSAPPPFTCSIVLDACSSGSCEDGDREPNARRPLCCPRRQVSRYQPDNLRRACVVLGGPRARTAPHATTGCWWLAQRITVTLEALWLFAPGNVREETIELW
jgi:hypothetical protein